MPRDLESESVAVMQEVAATDSERSAGGHPEQGRGGAAGARSGKAVVGAAAITVLAAVAMTRALADRPKGRTSEAGLGVVSKGAANASRAPGGGYASVEPDTGCGSWRRISFHKSIATDDEAECARACAAQPGCKFANWQSAHPDSGPDSNFCSAEFALQKGACYTFGDDCVRSKNPCWTLIQPRPEDLKPWGFQLVAQDVGCSNWREATIGEVRTVWNPYACSYECESEPACVQFNFQKEACTGEEMDCAEQQGMGSCYLFSAECARENNSHWDLYGKIGAASTGSTSPAATAASATSGSTPRPPTAATSAAAVATSALAGSTPVGTVATSTMPGSSSTGAAAFSAAPGPDAPDADAGSAAPSPSAAPAQAVGARRAQLGR